MAPEKRDLRILHEASLDRGWSWVVCVATCGSYFVLGGLLFSTGLVQTALLQQYGKSLATTSWAGSLYMALSNVAGPFGTVLINKADCRRALMVAGVMMATGFLITAFAPNFETCVVGCGVISGTGSGIAYSVSFVILGFNFRKKLNLVMGICVGGSGLGMFALSPLMEFVRELFGYQGIFLLLSSLSLQLVVFGALMRPSCLEVDLKTSRQAANHNRRHLTRKFESFEESVKSYGRVFFNKYLVCLSLSLGLYNGGTYISYLMWPSFCLAKGLTQMQAAFVISVSGVVYIFGKIITGIIASNKLVDERFLYSGSILIHSGILIFFQFYSDTFTGHMVNSVLLGWFNGSPWVLVTTFNAKYIGIDNLSTAIGIEFIFAGTGPLIISVIVGMMLNANCTYEQVFMFCGGALFLAALSGIAPMLCNNRSNDKELETTEIFV